MSKPENRSGENRAGMEQMSTASLEKMLLEDFYAPEQGEAGMGELYLAAQILEERGPDRRNFTDQAWERFRENYLPFAMALVEDGAHGRRHLPLRRRLVRTALAAALLCVLILSASLAAAAANGYDVRNLLARWTDEEIWLAPGQVVPAGKDDIHIPEVPKEYAGLQEALEDCGFTRPVVPQWMPEGFVFEQLVIDDGIEDELLFHALYQRGEDCLVVMLAIYLDDGNHSNFQKDEGAPVPYAAGGITHLLATNAGRPVAVWANGPAECGVIGDITMEELVRMIDSIYG